MTDNIKEIKFTPDKYMALFEAAKRDMASDNFKERQILVAEYNMLRYKAYIYAGFTEQQALELIK